MSHSRAPPKSKAGRKAGGAVDQGFVHEGAGLYELIFKSRRPEARQFKRWITRIVISEISKTGDFLHATADMTDEQTASRAHGAKRLSAPY